MFLIPQKYWEIRTTPQKGRGVFVRADIKAGQVIGDYLGKIVPGDYESDDENGHYWMWLNEKTSVLADPKDIGVHLINHSCVPNCDVDYHEGHVIFFANRKLHAGEEMTLDYALEPPPKGEVCNHRCECGSPFCRGSFHTSQEVIDRWGDYVEKRQGKYYDVLLGDLDSELKQLESYPEFVEDNIIRNLWGYEKDPVLLQNGTELTIPTIRKALRETGKQLVMPDQKSKICGFINGMMISDVFTPAQ
jgi:hypothetical protein